jgi:cytochrome c oxidase assembly factor CtaG
MPAMTALLSFLFVISAAGSADAHGSISDGIGASTWTYDAWIIVPLYGVALLYLVGSTRLWRHAGHGHGVRHWQAACFWSGWTILALALLSPLHWLGERLFVAHMVEHELLMVVAAPLLAVARPTAAMLWALPQFGRRAVGRLLQSRVIALPWRLIRTPIVATVLHTVALWIWHMPQLYNAVLTNVTMHRLQHAIFFFTALLFWWSLFYGAVRKQGYGIAIACLFFTSLQCAVLGIFLTLARQPWFSGQETFAISLGLTPLEDQQLAGLIMWVPPGFVYLGFALYFAGQWISRASESHAPGGRYGFAHL